MMGFEDGAEQSLLRPCCHIDSRSKRTADKSCAAADFCNTICHERIFLEDGGPQESVAHGAATPACGVRRLHDEYILKRNALRGDQGVMAETATSFLRAKGKVKGAS